MANKRINDLPNEATPVATDRFAIDGATTRSSEMGAAIAAMIGGDMSAARTALGLAIGADVQAYSAALAALIALASNGHIIRTGAATYAARTLTGSTGRVTVTNGDGVSGDPIVDWDGVQARKNSAGSTFTRRRINFIEGSNVTLTVADDAANDEVDVTIAAAISSAPGMVLIAAKTASASAQIDFTTELDNTYDDYLLVVSDFAPATDDGELQLLIGTGGGPTYQTSSYTWGADKVVGGGTTPWGSGVASAGSGVVSRIPLSPPAASEGVGNAAGETIRGNIWFSNPEVTKYHRFAFKMGFERFDNQDIGWDGNGSYRSSVALTGVRLKFASGNIASGVARLYGFRKTP